MATRKATHAGSWYSGSGATLRKELGEWLDAVPTENEGLQKLPYGEARMIIAPHAGYRYSGPTAAWAYKALDLDGIKRVFLLGPSHHIYLDTCALSNFEYYDTPMGKLRLDKEIIARLSQSGLFRSMGTVTDEDEHSLELHLPYLYKVFEDHFKSPDNFPSLVPILVGSTTTQAEKDFGTVLSEYLEDNQNAFVVSSDFAHWGKRFHYTNYLPDLDDVDTIIKLQGNSREEPTDPAIHESIGRIDHHIMERIEAGDHANYWNALEATGNTVCGRHPIGIMLSAMESLVRKNRLGTLDSHFRFIHYSRSSDCKHIMDSSVSYASAFAVISPGDIDREVQAEKGRFRGYDSYHLLEQLTGRKRDPTMSDGPDTPHYLRPPPWNISSESSETLNNQGRE